MAYRRVSFVAKFAGVCLAIIMVTAFSLGMIFMVNLRSITQRQAEAYIGESMMRLKAEVFAKLNGYEGLLKDTAAAVVSLFDAYAQGENAVSLRGVDINNIFPQKEMEDFLIQTMKSQPDVSYLYYANNIRWGEPGSYFAINDRWIPEDDYDQTGRSWFVNAKKAAGDIAYSDPFIEASTGKLTIALSMIVFDRSEKDSGVVTAEIPVDSFAEILQATQGMDQQIYLLDQNGLFIVHSDKDAVMKKNFFTEYHLESVKTQALSESQASVMVGGIYLYSAAIPDSGWRVVSLIPGKTIFAEVNALIIKIILVSVVLLITAGICAVIFTRRMLASPIKEIKQIAGSIADRDFTARIQRLRTDEIGDIQIALIKIRDSLKKAMDDLNEHIEKVTLNSKRLKTAIVESSDALGTITNNMDAMQGETETQMESVAQTSCSVDEIIKSIDSLDHAVQTQAAHITQSSAAIEEMVAHIASIRSIVSEVMKTTDTLSKYSLNGHTLLVKLTTAINHIQEQSATLQNANKTIADIAGQTNILAMNAAIEAAHAGESGKGFAVVAGEIRKLAELSGKESNAISEEIKKIEQGIEQITGVSAQTVGAMDRIFTGIKTMDNSFAQVNHAVEEQSAGGSQILTALKMIQDMTGQVRDGASSIHRQSGLIHEKMATLRRISQDVASRAFEVKTASGSIASFLEDTKALAE